MTDAEKIAALEDQCARLRADVDAQADDWVDVDRRREEVEDRAKSLCALLEQAKEHVPPIAVYGIDHRAIEEALK
jgi:hypothetical protein